MEQLHVIVFSLVAVHTFFECQMGIHCTTDIQLGQLSTYATRSFLLHNGEPGYKAICHTCTSMKVIPLQVLPLQLFSILLEILYLHTSVKHA